MFNRHGHEHGHEQHIYLQTTTKQNNTTLTTKLTFQLLVEFHPYRYPAPNNSIPLLNHHQQKQKKNRNIINATE